MIHLARSDLKAVKALTSNDRQILSTASKQLAIAAVNGRTRHKPSAALLSQSRGRPLICPWSIALLCRSSKV